MTWFRKVVRKYSWLAEYIFIGFVVIVFLIVTRVAVSSALDFLTVIIGDGHSDSVVVADPCKCPETEGEPQNLSTRDVDSDSLFTAITSLSALITAFAILGSIITAFIAYQNTVRTTKVQKTLDFIYRQSHDKDLIELFASVKRIIGKYRKKRIDITYDAVLQEQDNIRRVLDENDLQHNLNPLQDRDYILNLLNYYETWAIGLKNKALDEGVLHSWWRATLVQHWIEFHEFVQGHRRHTRRARAFVEFEELAKKWASEDEQNFC